MPLLPIDLQTIFSQIGNVGKDQAVQRDVLPIAQTLRASEMVQQTNRNDRSVNETHDSREGEKVSLDERHKGSQEREHAKRSAGGEGQEEKPPAEVFRDPALGAHIDVVR